MAVYVCASEFKISNIIYLGERCKLAEWPARFAINISRSYKCIIGLKILPISLVTTWRSNRATRLYI